MDEKYRWVFCATLISVMKTVFVGLSGGVDSSVSAALLKEQGYDVVGVFMKNWAQDIGGWECPWRDDYQDAKRVAVQLGIPFEMFDFQNDYREKVVDYMLDTYKRGETPNPDVMCNQEIKFRLYFDTAMEQGADLIATGHYARSLPLSVVSANTAQPAAPHDSSRTTSSDSAVLSQSANLHTSLRASNLHRISSMSEKESASGTHGLFKARDDFKDQTYFLYRVEQVALQKTLFPLGDMLKTDVKAEAKKRGLVTAGKKESMGICFVGKVGIKDFLKEFVETNPGPIVDQNGNEIGQHDGAIFYTIGQRSGLGVGGGLPYYVTHKDMSTNTVYVTSDITDQKLWSNTIQLTSQHWINNQPQPDKTYQVRYRHQGELIDCSYANDSITLNKDVKALSPGQSAVVYDGDVCLGGGIISA
ncbi:TPA: tRNA-specific 2-thiouridylase [Candidatus Saccharibacteria bacterium]|nr:tRNA-specific 2-thiouridylase [Candidatus Saccharibacteria bacterium]HIO87622.1 tRNA-specific 2-thiouridylase [Candidatus Saccharibacteria bacterium]